MQVSVILARDEDHASPGEDESDKDEAELPELECVPEKVGEGACKAEPPDTKQADQAYIEALELLKFDTAELVVRMYGDVTSFARTNHNGNTINQSINNFINVSVRSSLHIRKLIGDTYLLVN